MNRHSQEGKLKGGDMNVLDGVLFIGTIVIAIIFIALELRKKSDDNSI